MIDRAGLASRHDRPRHSTNGIDTRNIVYDTYQRYSTQTMKILVDDRERCVIPFFKLPICAQYDIEVEVKRIHIGDYAIYHRETLLFIIERKTWKDLSASIKDGRKSNINNLLQLREETRCKVILLMEGPSRFAANKCISRIPYKNLQAHIDHLVIRDNVYVIYASSPEDTAYRLIEFAKNYLSIDTVSKGPVAPASPMPPASPPVEIKGSAVLQESKEGLESQGSIEKETENILQEGILSTSLDLLTRPKNKTDLEIIYNIWRCVPNITDKTTTIFIEHGFHISDLILGRIKNNDISTMTYPNGSIVGKRAQKILSIQNTKELKNIKIYANMLACLKGVTIKTAHMLLNKFEIKKILSNEIPSGELAEFQKTPSAKLGKCVEANIFKFFIKI